MIEARSVPRSVKSKIKAIELEDPHVKAQVGISAIAAFLLTVTAGQANPGTLTTIGSIPHLAWGGGWQSVIFLSNYGTTDASVVVNTYGDNGTPIQLPWVDPFTGSRTGISGAPVTSLNLTVRAGAVVAFFASGGDTTFNSAWAQILSDSTSVTGGVNFKYNINQTHGEGMVALDTGTGKTWDLLFFSERDSVNCDFAYEYTAYAFANTSTNPVTITRTVVDRSSGVQQYQDQVTLQPRNHIAFVGWDVIPQPNNTGAPIGVWMMRISAPGPGLIAPMVLHFRQDKGGLTEDGKACRMGPLVFESAPVWMIP